MPTATVDTLIVNEAMVDSFAVDHPYFDDMAGDVEEQGSSLLTELFKALARVISDLLDGVTGSDSKPVWQIAALLSLVAFVALMFLYRDRIAKYFKRNTAVDFEVVDDNIYNIDFDNEIKRARDSGNHSLLVRLYYLKSLRALADGGKVEWVPGKTPSQYATEAALQPMSTLTTMFLRVRYGKYAATATEATTAATLCNAITGASAGEKGGDA